MSAESVVLDFPAQFDSALEEVARTLFEHGLEPRRAEVAWEYPDDDTVRAIAKAFGTAWFFDIGQETEWAEARVGPVYLTITLVLGPDRQPRLPALIGGVGL